MFMISPHNRAAIRLPSSSTALAALLTTAAAVLLWITPVTRAQEETLTIQLAWPAEGETLYAGPSSLLYSVHVNGWVQGIDLEQQDVEVVLEILQGEGFVEEISTTPGRDGEFEFLLTVNPDGSDGAWPAEHLTCGDYCHLPGQADLPVGNLTLRITATSHSDNQQVTVERNITVDRSVYATVPVEVYLGGNLDHPVSDVEVKGSTRLYLWRTRHVKGVTDETGAAFVQVEALSQAPTHYVFSALPTIVDGILYEPTDSAEITIEPGEISGGAIFLNVSAKMGEIRGSLESAADGPLGGVPIVAIQMPGGFAYRTVTMGDGTFRFEDMPVDRYRITAGEDISSGYNSKTSVIDVNLFESIKSRADLKAVDLEGVGVQGQIFGDSGLPLPFAWVRTEDAGSPTTVFPVDGRYTLTDLQDDPVTLIAQAPGFYSQAHVVDPSSDSLTTTDFVLIRQDETELIPWGIGEIIIPAESDVQRDDVALTLRRGWLWGRVEGEPLKVQAAGKELTLADASFSIEYLPGQRAWLYLADGSAEVTPLGGGEKTDVQAGQMINLLNDSELVAVPMDPVVIHALRDDSDPIVAEIWQPTIGARIQNSLARLGIGTVQMVTFVTYFIVILGVLIIPFFAVYWWWKRRT